MKVEVNQEKCVACGMCVYEPSANGAFAFNEEGTKAMVVNPEVNDDIRNIADACPYGAIIIS